MFKQGDKIKRIRGGNFLFCGMVRGNYYTVSAVHGNNLQVEEINGKWFDSDYFELEVVKKFIKVTWVKEDIFGYGMAMRVVESNHERFTVGSRFDYGFFNIATREGYTILSEPSPEVIEEK